MVDIVMPPVPALGLPDGVKEAGQVNTAAAEQLRSQILLMLGLGVSSKAARRDSLSSTRDFIPPAVLNTSRTWKKPQKLAFSLSFTR